MDRVISYSELPFTVKVETFNFQKFGMYKAEVQEISADAVNDPSDQLRNMKFKLILDPTSNDISVYGKPAKIVGRICMDQTMLDVTDIDNVRVGDEVIVFGSGEHGEPTADTLAENTGTINYEVVCLVGKRVPRIYYQNGIVTDVMYKL